MGSVFGNLPPTLGGVGCGRGVLREDTACKGSDARKSMVLGNARCYVRLESRTYLRKEQVPKVEKVGRK